MPKKGYKFTDEQRQRQSIAHLGQRSWNKGMIGYNKGHPYYAPKDKEIWKASLSLAAKNSQKLQKHIRELSRMNMGHHRKPTIETKTKIRNSLLGNIPWNKGKKGLQKAWNKGIAMSEEAKRKLSIAKKAWRWKQILPVKDTTIEIKVRELLDSLYIKYRKHFPIYHKDMGYHQVDIMILDHEGNPKIAIECDGCYWHSCPIHCKIQNQKVVERDRLIDRALSDLNIKVLRLWEHDIRANNINLEVMV